MTKVPVVFCFDDNLLMPAGVCISSLLQHARAQTFYDIFILHATDCRYPQSGFLEQLHLRYTNFRITYKDVGTIFCDAFEIRNITIAAYYRLLIPKLIKEYDVVMYHDIDIIFRDDLSDIFFSTDMSSCYVAGVNFAGAMGKEGKQYINNLGLDWKNYILSGDLILNLALLREDHIVPLFEREVNQSQYIYQDMDIINIVCKGKIKRLPPVFCGSLEIFELASKKIEQPLYTQQELQDVLLHGIVHYNGVKPWETVCPNMDIWWECYRKSIYYNPQFHFDFFCNKLDDYDRLSLWRRVKILSRYFTKGKIK